MKTVFALLAACSLSAVPAALSMDAATYRKVKTLQANVDQAFLLQYLHRNKEHVQPASGQIRDIGVRIVRATGRAFSNKCHFYAVDEPVVNASTSPGGNIFIYQGLLGAGLTQDEMAALLGHEIGHILRYHWLARLQRNMDAQRMAQYTAKSYGRNSAQIAYLMQAMRNLAYDRNEEFEADQTGVQLMVDAGFDPRGMASLLGKVQALQSPRQAKAASNPYLASHPAIPDRIARIQAILGAGSLKPTRKRLF